MVDDFSSKCYVVQTSYISKLALRLGAFVPTLKLRHKRSEIFVRYAFCDYVVIHFQKQKKTGMTGLFFSITHKIISLP